MSDSVTRSQVVRLSDLTVVQATIRDRTFQDCLILGPAIVTLTGAGTIARCIFEGEPDALLWEVAPEREQIIGVIEMANCHFVGCRFEGIGFAGDAQFVEAFRAHMAGATAAL